MVPLIISLTILRKEAKEEWRRSQLELLNREDTQADIAATKTLDKWEQSHLPKKKDEITQSSLKPKGKKRTTTNQKDRRKSIKQ
jgi:hypothetical protein